MRNNRFCRFAVVLLALCLLGTSGCTLPDWDTLSKRSARAPYTMELSEITGSVTRASNIGFHNVRLVADHTLLFMGTVTDTGVLQLPEDEYAYYTFYEATVDHIYAAPAAWDPKPIVSFSVNGLPVQEGITPQVGQTYIFMIDLFMGSYLEILERLCADTPNTYAYCMIPYVDGSYGANYYFSMPITKDGVLIRNEVAGCLDSAYWEVSKETAPDPALGIPDPASSRLPKDEWKAYPIECIEASLLPELLSRSQ